MNEIDGKQKKEGDSSNISQMVIEVIYPVSECFPCHISYR
jgi:hypothetical protein